MGDAPGIEPSRPVQLTAVPRRLADSERERPVGREAALRRSSLSRTAHGDFA